MLLSEESWSLSCSDAACFTADIDGGDTLEVEEDSPRGLKNTVGTTNGQPPTNRTCLTHTTKDEGSCKTTN